MAAESGNDSSIHVKSHATFLRVGSRGFVDRSPTFDEGTTVAMTHVYNILADLLEYPSPEWADRMGLCANLARQDGAETLTNLNSFRDRVQTLSPSALQELYTRTFDLNPVCALDIGYHLFGENYKRGVFLANLRETEAAFDLGQKHQLPDYLPVLLRLLTKLDDQELRGALIVDCMIPALEKMLKTLSDSDNPYRHLIEAVRETLQSEVSAHSTEPAARHFFKRASLPVLKFDPRNTEGHEFTPARDFAAAEFRIGAKDFVDSALFDLKTNPDLF